MFEDLENGGDENGTDELMVTPPKSKEKRKNDEPPSLEKLQKSPSPASTPPPSKRPRRSVNTKPKEPETKKGKISEKY